MSFQRDLAWDYLNQVEKSSVAYQLSRYASALSFNLLPPEVVHQVKRCLLDTLGCAIGAYNAPGRTMCENVIRQLGGNPEATVFGSGLRTSAYNATMVNSYLVRFLDFNDIGGGGHNSDSIPAILAVAEKSNTKPNDLITAIVTSYEIGARFSEAAGFRGATGETGWTFDIRAALNMPASLGKLMGLNLDQIANAIGICASHSLPLGVLDTDKEENTNTKNLRFGFVSCDAIIACMLAKQGFSGPVRVIEGENGLDSVVLNGSLKKYSLLDFSGWRILNTRHKPLCLNGATIGHALATLAIVIENNLQPLDIASVKIRTSVHEAQHTTVLPKKYPRNAESADHSSYYATAAAIKDRKLGPDTFDIDKFTDPVILGLIEKVQVEGDPNIRGFAGVSEIMTTDGRRFEKRIDAVHGLGNDPLSDRELEDKFKGNAEKYLENKQISKIIDTVWNIEKLDKISSLTGLMTADNLKNSG